MESKLPFRNEVEKDMGIIEEEETSEEDNSSKEEIDVDLVMVKPKTITRDSSKALPNNQATYESGEITDIKSDSKLNKLDVNMNTSGNNKYALDSSSLRKSFREEETKISNNNLSNSFNEFQDNYDFIRQPRSSSCKSAAASLKFSKSKYLNKFSKSPFMPLTKRSHHMSSSLSQKKNHMSSLLGIANRKMSEPSLYDSLRKLESNSKWMSELSWNITHLEADTKRSMPLQRYGSNSSMSSEYSAKGGNTSTSTLTYPSDHVWEIRSWKLIPVEAWAKQNIIDTEFPFRKRRDKTRPMKKLVDALPELIEWEENLEEELDLSKKQNRISILKDLNEFGRKGKRHRSLDGRKRKKVYNNSGINNFQCDYDVSETEEEDWISDDSIKEKGKSLSKFSRIFNKIYADHFERPIRMKQIKEKSRRNIHMLGDTPISEDSNDGSNKSGKGEIISDTSSSNMSFRKKNIHAFFDKLEMPEQKILRQTTDIMLSRLDRWKMFDLTVNKKIKPKKKQTSFKINSDSLNNEPILEENDEDNEAIDPDYHHFALKAHDPSYIIS